MEPLCGHAPCADRCRKYSWSQSSESRHVHICANRARVWESRSIAPELSQAPYTLRRDWMPYPEPSLKKLFCEGHVIKKMRLCQAETAMRLLRVSGLPQMVVAVTLREIDGDSEEIP